MSSVVLRPPGPRRLRRSRGRSSAGSSRIVRLLAEMACSLPTGGPGSCRIAVSIGRSSMCSISAAEESRRAVRWVGLSTCPGPWVASAAQVGIRAPRQWPSQAQVRRSLAPGGRQRRGFGVPGPGRGRRRPGFRRSRARTTEARQFLPPSGLENAMSLAGGPHRKLNWSFANGLWTDGPRQATATDDRWQASGGPRQMRRERPPQPATDRRPTDAATDVPPRTGAPPPPSAPQSRPG